MNRSRLVASPGHVIAFCAVDARDVVIPEGTLKCPHGDHDVEPTSLPRMPKSNPAVTAEPVPAEQKPSSPAPGPAPATDRVVVPDWLKEGKAWVTATERFAEALAAEDANLTADVRQVRTVRKLVDAVLDRIKPTAPGSTS